VVIPRFPRLKEWAYAGVFFDLTGAVSSQLASGLIVHKKQGFWSKVGPSLDQTKKEADSLRIGLSLYRIIAIRRRIVLSLEKPFPIGHQRTFRRRRAKAEYHEVRGLPFEFVALRLVSCETPLPWGAELFPPVCPSSVLSRKDRV
jgi:hypothetical protein